MNFTADKKNLMKSFIRAMLVVIAVDMNMEIIPYELIANDNKLIRCIYTIMLSINNFGIISAIATVMLLKPLMKSFYQRNNYVWICRIPAVLFSMFMIIGYSFHMQDSYYLLFGDWDLGQTCKTILQFIGYYNLFYMSLEHFYYFIFEKCVSCKEDGSTFINAMLDKRPILAPFCILSICWLPFLIAFFPGFIQGDTPDQIRQFFGMADNTSDYLNLINEEMVLNNHHPVIHTLLLGGCFKVGHVLGSDNLGIFLYVIIQYVILAMAISFGLYYLKKLQLSHLVRAGILAFYALVPIFSNYALLTTKDVYYSIGLLGFVIFLADLSINDFAFYNNKRYLCIYVISCIVAVLFRHNGIYVLLISLLGVLIAWKNHRKFAIKSIVGLVLLSTVINSFILPAFQITGGSRREALSVPMQQTARYIYEYGDELTPDEYQEINAVMDVNFCKYLYEPRFADPVKATFNENASQQDLVKYFKNWFFMFFKHPGCYVEAFLNNTYGYFYFGDAAVWKYDKTESENVQSLINPSGFNIHHIDKLHSLSTFAEFYIKLFNHLPIISLFHCSAFYTWVLIVLIAIILYKSKHSFATILPLIASVLVCFAGPLNGTADMRYMFPVVFILPVFSGICIKIVDGNKLSEGK